MSEQENEGRMMAVSFVGVTVCFLSALLKMLFF